MLDGLSFPELISATMPFLDRSPDVASREGS